MSRHRRVSNGTWGDRRFMALSDDAKLLWFRFLTGPEVTNVPGLLVTGRAALAEAMVWPQERLDSAFAELARPDAEHEQPMAVADWQARLVWLPSAHKRNVPSNPNVVIGWRDNWAAIPECALKVSATAVLRQMLADLGESFTAAFAKFAKLPAKVVSRTVTETVSQTLPETIPQTVAGTVADTVSETVCQTIPRARATAPDPDPVISESGSDAREPAPPPARVNATGPFPDWTVRLEGNGWVDAYVQAVRAVAKPANPEWTLDSRSGVWELARLLGDLCTGDNRRDIPAWIDRAVRAFVTSVQRLPDFQIGFWSQLGPKGLRKWFNEGKPGLRKQKPATAPPRPSNEPSPPAMSTAEALAHATALSEQLDKIGNWGVSGE